MKVHLNDQCVRIYLIYTIYHEFSTKTIRLCTFILKMHSTKTYEVDHCLWFLHASQSTLHVRTVLPRCFRRRCSLHVFTFFQCGNDTTAARTPRTPNSVQRSRCQNTNALSIFSPICMPPRTRAAHKVGYQVALLHH